ncbi:diheme cytochrome c [Anthocerotibacter panamensis]|uniref:diheme cytochrome c n=1 Tax=Anthocerotibacter panamensis TaxID=2857077 RepID=UPI001C4034CC|nr:diheme cytochrome c [Anthocerotibacter panamensis]
MKVSWRIGLTVLVVGTSLLLGRVLARVEPGPLPKRYVLAEQIYMQHCAACHVALPPEVLPSQTWRDLLSESGHYGRTLPPINSLERQLIYLYLKDFSRPTKEGEPTPYLVSDSRFFKALHPKVALPSPLNLESCISCHAKAPMGDYQVAPESTPTTP